jgi:hypothetical protein
MATPAPHHQPNPADEPFARVFAKRLLKTLAAAMPNDPSDDAPTREENQQAMHALFTSLNPRDPAEAQLAAIAIAAASSAMDNFVRAIQPGVSNDMALRLRGNALNAGRTYSAMLRTLRGTQPRQAAARPAPVAAPEPPPRPATPLHREPVATPDLPLRRALLTKADLLGSTTRSADPVLQAALTAQAKASIAALAIRSNGTSPPRTPR